MIPSGQEPFVLCEDARPEGADARLFARPARTISALRLEEVQRALEAVREGLRQGYYAAGWLSYEAGFALEPRLARLQTGDESRLLLWFGLFENCEYIACDAVANLLPRGGGAWLSAPRPRMSRSQYGAAFDRIQHYLRAGDTYQVNLSYRADVSLFGDPLEAYAQLRKAGGGGFSALVRHDARWMLSTSPELFFRVQDGLIEARPMKGTARRHEDTREDQKAADTLRNDPKERAENIMIVDLLRNDVSKIAARGSVHVPALLTLETYPTLHTLTSTIRAKVSAKADTLDILRALFPCGSVTGAPKMRAMEIIDEIELGPRGAYTGAIGWMSPNGDAAFNVAIRTLSITGDRAEIGLGSAVVVDSDCEKEWQECQAKGAFITAAAPHFDLIETLRYDPQTGFVRLDRHMERLARSAAAFGVAYNEPALRRLMAAEAQTVAGASLVRVLVSMNGEARIEFKPLPSFSNGEAIAALAPMPVAAADFRLRHKTSSRAFYDDARARCGADEVVFHDAEGFVTEGSFTNVFVEREGALLTPPLERGLLPGVLRAELLAAGRAREADLTPIDLEDGFFIGNSVRGLIPAKLKE